MELHCPQCQHVLDQDNGHALPILRGSIEMKAFVQTAINAAGV